MKNHLKNESGVTMIILVLMIIVILIISTVGIYTGIDAYRSMKVQTFIAQMQTVKDKINIVKEEYKSWDDYNGTNIDNFILEYNQYVDEDGFTKPTKVTALSPTHPDRIAFEKAISEETSISGEDKVLANYFYFTSKDLEKIFGLKSLNINVIINFHTGTFLDRDGVEVTTLFGRDAKTYALDAAISLINRGYFSSDSYFDASDEDVTSLIKISNIYLVNNTAEATVIRIKLNNIIEVNSVKYKSVGDTAWEDVGDYIVNNTTIELIFNPKKVGKYVFQVEVKGSTIESEPFEITKVNPPTMYGGMKKIVISDTGVAQEIDPDYDVEWYNYSSAEKKWANAILPDGSIYVWIPRFAYKLYDDRIDIIFLMENTDHSFGDTVNVESLGYTIHPAFTAPGTYTNGEYKVPLSGIWVSKFDNFIEENASYDASDPLSPKYLFRSLAEKSFDESKYIGFLDAMGDLRKMEVNLNLYSFDTTGRTDNGNLKSDYTFVKDTNGIDTHLIKNSEYGALLFLTHSNYGIGIISLNYITDNISGGKGGISKNLLSSTTGNVYGVYDLTNTVPDYVACGTAEYLRSNPYFGTSGVATSNQYITVYADNLENSRVIGDCMVDSKIFGFFAAQVIRQEYFSTGKGILSRGGKTEFDFVATSFQEIIENVNQKYGIRSVILVGEDF